MSEKRVAVITPDGKFGTIGEEFADEIVRAGGRLLTKQQAEEHEADERQAAAERAVQERYDALPSPQKFVGVLNTVLGATTPLTIGSSSDAPPEIAAYGAGVSQGLTGDLLDGAVRQGVDVIAGKEAGERYAQRAEQEREASPWAHGLGKLAGTAAGVIAPAGAAAEKLGARAAARGLSYAAVDATSAAGRAATTAMELGARGAVEGALIGGGEYVGDTLLKDHDLAADKLFASVGTGALYGGATGAILGGGGSLLASGAKTGLTRAFLPRAADESITRIATDAALDPAAKAAAVERLTQQSAAKRMANDLAVESLNATKVQMRNALEHAADQAAEKLAVGEYLNWEIIGKERNGLTGAFKAGWNGRADDLLSAIQADKYGRIANGLSDAVKGTPARVNINDVAAKAYAEYGNMLRDPQRFAGADPFIRRVSGELDALRLSGKMARDGTIDAADAFYLRSELAKNAYELNRLSGHHAGEAYKAFLRDLDSTTIRAIDEAGAAAGKTGVGDNIRYWKRQWQLATEAEEMAQGGAERIAGNNTIGLREGIAGATAMMTGHVVADIAGPIALKIAKERGKAVAAYALSKLSERAMLAKVVETTNKQIAQASKGLLAPPVKGVFPLPQTKHLVRTTLARVAAFQADPDAFVDKATRHVEAVATHSPEIASTLVQRQVQAMTFLSNKVPQQDDPDPFDPHKAPKMTANEEAEFGRYAYYVDKPERFFAEVAKGKLVPEGAEVAQALMPRAFDELRAQTADALATQLARGTRIPFRQRLLLGTLLDFAATPSQRPEHARFLQQNVVDSAAPSDKIPKSAPAKSRAASIPSQRSSLDQLEAGGPGRR